MHEGLPHTAVPENREFAGHSDLPGSSNIGLQVEHCIHQNELGMTQ